MIVTTREPHILIASLLIPFKLNISYLQTSLSGYPAPSPLQRICDIPKFKAKKQKANAETQRQQYATALRHKDEDHPKENLKTHVLNARWREGKAHCHARNEKKGGGVPKRDDLGTGKKLVTR